MCRATSSLCLCSAPAKGPYSWFSRSNRSQPAPNWEYFVQVAVWLDLVRALPAGTQVGFEDELWTSPSEEPTELSSGAWR